jgi:hypothetical protein
LELVKQGPCIEVCGQPGKEEEYEMADNRFSRLYLLLVLCTFQSLPRTSRYPLPLLQTGETGIAYAMEFSADSKTLAAANGHRVTLWDRECRWLVGELIGHTADVQAIAFAPAGKTGFRELKRGTKV